MHVVGKKTALTWKKKHILEDLVPVTRLKWCTHTVLQPMLPGCFWRRWRGARENLSRRMWSPNPKRNPRTPQRQNRSQRDQRPPRSLVTSDFNLGDHGNSLMELTSNSQHVIVFYFWLPYPPLSCSAEVVSPSASPFWIALGIEFKYVFCASLMAKCAGLAFLAVMLPTTALTNTTVHSYDLRAHILGLSPVVF